MGEKITISVDGEPFEGKLNETETAQFVLDTLPLEAEPSFWGEEIYFEIPQIFEENEEPTEEVEVGDLAFWPEGNAFCIFYGPTASSEGSEPKPASPVTIIGTITSEVTPLKELDPFDTGKIRVKKG